MKGSLYVYINLVLLAVCDEWRVAAVVGDGVCSCRVVLERPIEWQFAFHLVRIAYNQELLRNVFVYS